MANKASKGSAFEREVCKRLSLWWTQDEDDGSRDDVFWRTSNSGGRATTRGKSGKKTKNQYGDVGATDLMGQPLLDLVTIEIKRGYNSSTIADLLDKPLGAAKQRYEEWIEKIIKTSEEAKTPYWLLITRRDRRETIIVLLDDFGRKLCNFGGTIPMLRFDILVGKPEHRRSVIAVPLIDFLDQVEPYDVERLKVS